MTTTTRSRASHDQRFKILFQSCLPDLIRITHPRIAAKLRFDRCRFLDKETFTDLLGGSHKVMDLVALLPTTDGQQRLVLLLIETEEKNRKGGTAAFDRRIAQYTLTLWLRHDIPVLPIVVWFAPHHGGLGQGRFRLTALGQTVFDLHYRRVGIRGLSAQKFLRAKNPLGHALAVRMDSGGLSKVDLRLACEKRLAKDPVDEHIRHLLLSCISTYAGLNPSQMKEYQKKLLRPENKEALTMHLDSEERGIKKGIKKGLEKGLEQGIEKGLEQGIEKGLEQGRKEGLRLAVLRTFTVRFGELSAVLLVRLEQVEKVKPLNDLLDLVLTAPDRATAESRLDRTLP